ncbi:hypothetical protein [Pedobacter sp. AJM]|nr:hypothetical protein [Pedobacter sp. AJM]
MKKLELSDLEKVKASGPRECWGVAGYYLLTSPISGIGLVIGAACYVSSL